MSIKHQILASLLLSALLVGCHKNPPNEMTVASAPAPVSTPLSTQTKNCLKGYGVSYEQLAHQFALFQTAVQQDNPSEAAALISYPLRVNFIKNNQHMSHSINNTAQLTIKWPNLLSPAVKQKILAAHGEDSEQMICNDQGIGFADGAVWFFGDSSAQIYVINNTAQS